MERILIQPGYARRNRTIISPQIRPYLREKNWIGNSNEYEGYYRTKHGAWRGKIIRGIDSWEFYICNPPQSVLYGEHEACFKPEGDGWYWIHWQSEPKNLSDGIMAVERLIDQSFAHGYANQGERSWWRQLLGGD
jgi:hypothetical protein